MDLYSPGRRCQLIDGRKEKEEVWRKLTNSRQSVAVGTARALSSEDAFFFWLTECPRRREPTRDEQNSRTVLVQYPKCFDGDVSRSKFADVG